MKMYCMCRAAPIAHFGNDDNGEVLEIAGEDSEAVVGVALPEFAMHVEEMGAKQFIIGTPKGNALSPSTIKESGIEVRFIRQHFPNVDIRECRYCGARIAVEG